MPKPKDHTPRFRPFMPGPPRTPPGLRERIVNFTGTTERQQRRLIEAAAQLLRRGDNITHDTLRATDGSLSLMDVMPEKLIDAANAVRSRLPRLADELALAGYVPAGEIHALRLARADRLMAPTGFVRLGTDWPVWRMKFNDGSEILVSDNQTETPTGILAAPEAPVWTANRFDELTNILGHSGAAQPLADLIPILDRMRRETVR
jgi:hypothetical protein